MSRARAFHGYLLWATLIAVVFLAGLAFQKWALRPPAPCHTNSIGTWCSCR